MPRSCLFMQCTFSEWGQLLKYKHDDFLEKIKDDSCSLSVTDFGDCREILSYFGYIIFGYIISVPSNFLFNSFTWCQIIVSNLWSENALLWFLRYICQVVRQWGMTNNHKDLTQMLQALSSTKPSLHIFPNFWRKNRATVVAIRSV